MASNGELGRKWLSAKWCVFLEWWTVTGEMIPLTKWYFVGTIQIQTFGMSIFIHQKQIRGNFARTIVSSLKQSSHQSQSTTTTIIAHKSIGLPKYTKQCGCNMRSCCGLKFHTCQNIAATWWACQHGRIRADLRWCRDYHWIEFLKENEFNYCWLSRDDKRISTGH